MFKNGNLMKKMVVLGVCVCVFATGCQGVEKESQNGENVTGQETQKSETQKSETPKPEPSEKKGEVYYEKKVDLGQKTTADIRLTAESDAVSGKKFYVDGEEIDLSAKENLKTENCQHVNVFTEDIDQDGTKEIIVAFYGGAGGTFQQFCMMKKIDKKWKAVEGEDAPLDSSLIQIEKKTSQKIMVKVTNCDFEKEISLSEKDKIEDVSDIHTEGDLFNVTKEGIVIDTLLLNQAQEGKELGKIEQKICYDEKTKQLKITETKFVS